MIATDIGRAALLAGLAALAWANLLSICCWPAAAALSGALGVAFELARSAWVAQSAAPERLPARNAQLSAAGSISETLAFALGGWLYQLLGAVLALAADALSYLLSALCLRRRAQRARPRGQRTSGTAAGPAGGDAARRATPPASPRLPARASASWTRR